MHLLYFADPMCSWCYGFGPQLEKLIAAHPDARLDIVMGGLRPFNREPMSPAFRDMLREHWQHVTTATGLPFSQAILERDDFLYDTEPACRAVVTARQLASTKAWAFLKAVQAAFYRDGREVTRPLVLAEIAEEQGYDRAAFVEAFESEEMRTETLTDFTTTKTLGVSGFPTVGIAYGKQLYLVTSGFVTDDVLEYRLAEIERRATAAS